MNQKQHDQKQAQPPRNQPIPTQQKYTIRTNMFRLPPEERSRLADLYFSGTLALSAILLPILLSKTTLDPLDFSALLCIVVALPVLSGVLITKHAYKRLTNKAALTGIFATLCIIAGAVLMLWHLSWIIALVFLLTAFITANFIEWFDPHSHW